MGLILSKYELHETLGKGGFGTVYRAIDTSLGREVALKVLHPQLMVDENFVERFKKEARILASFDHPNIVTIYDMGEVDGRVFIAMKYLSGGNLQARIQKEGGLPFEEAKRIMGQVCEGLQAAHEQGMVHRDLKPANILFDGRGNAVISDFGLAKIVQMSGTSSSLGVVGTPAYRAPELWRGTPPASPATDVYSLGCIFVEMLTGKVLFDGATPDEIITQHLVDGPKLTEELESRVTPQTKDFFLNTLEKEMGKRPENAQKFIAGLNESLLKKVEVFYEITDGKPGQNHIADIERKITKKTESNLMKVELAPGVEMEFVRIPAGEFLMGSDPGVDQDAERNEFPQHPVYLDEYWIGKFPVTNEQYQVFVAVTKTKSPKLWIKSDIPKGKEKHPVGYINWKDSRDFCYWLSKKTRLKIDLPTEAQWEKAARGTDGRIYPWGNASPDKSLANYDENISDTTEVGSYPDGVSPYGIVDMAGNVWEWVSDWYGSYPSGSVTDPQGPSTGDYRVLRGGSWYDVAGNIRSAIRYRDLPAFALNYYGFRCALSLH